MSTFTLEELDREEIEFLPPRVVMTVANPCYQPCPPPCAPVQHCAPVLQITIKVRIGCLFGGDMRI